MAGEDERSERKGGRAGEPSGEDVRPPPRDRDSRVALDKVLPELLRRGLLAGRDVGESFFPKELASNIAAQLVDARHGLVSAIANEVGRFLRQADIASEVRKVLSGLNVEAKVSLRFHEDESGKLNSRVDFEPPNSPTKRSKSTPPPEDG